MDLVKPKNLRSLPSPTLYDSLISFFKNESFDVRLKKLSLEQLHKNKVQLTWRNGRWEIFLSSVRASRSVFEDVKNIEKVIIAEKYPNHLMSKFLGINLVFSNHNVWKRQRSVLNPPFKKQFQISVFKDIICNLFEIIDEKYDGKQINIYNYMQKVTMDSLGAGIMGVKFNCVKDESTPFIKAYNSIMKEMIVPFYIVFQKLDAKWNPFRKFAYEQLEILDKSFKAILNEKKEKIKNQSLDSIEGVNEDILSLMVKDNLKGDSGLTDKEIRDNIMIFILAGHDTTAFAMAAALHFLALHKTVQDKVRDEIRKVMKLSNNNTANISEMIFPTIEEIKEMEYLDSVIKETLRLYPSVSYLPLRNNNKEIKVEGYTIPPGSNLVLDIYTMHRDPEYFSDPNKFIPERFIPNSKYAKTAIFNTNAYNPFGGGTRTCIGINFSKLEQKIVLAMILSRYKITYGKDFLHCNNILKLSPCELLSPVGLRLDFIKLN